MFDRTKFSCVVFVVFIYLYCRTTSLQFVLLCFPLRKLSQQLGSKEKQKQPIGAVLVKSFSRWLVIREDGNSRSISRIPNILFKAKILKKHTYYNKEKIAAVE